MGNTGPLCDRTILLLEDDPAVAFEIGEALTGAGAKIVLARDFDEGMDLAEQPELSAAILDFTLHDGDSMALSERLEERCIPYVIHSNFTELQLHYDPANYLSKPANAATLIAKVCGMLSIVHPHK